MSGPKVVDIRAVRASQERSWKKLRHRIEQERGQLNSLGRTENDEATSRSIAALEEAIFKLDTEHQNSPLPNLLDSVLDQAAAQLELALQLKAELEQARLERLATEHAKRRSMRIAVEGTAERLQAANLTEVRTRLLGDPSEANLQAALDALAIVQEDEFAGTLQDAVDEMSGPMTEVTFDQWLATHVVEEDPVIVRLERLAAGVSSTNGLQDVAAWLEQIAAAAQIADLSQRRLKTDSIAIRLSDERQRLQRQRERTLQLDKLEAELAAFGESADPQRDRIAEARKRQTESITALDVEIRQWCDEESQRQDQAESRQAILTVLRSLGYEVRESMATAWTEDGQVVVRDSSRQDYGVELSTLEGNRLKTQLVRFGDQSASTNKQKQRDVEVETQWCESHGKIVQELENNGLRTDILAARKIGATPVKVVRRPNANQSKPALEARPKQRQQKESRD